MASKIIVSCTEETTFQVKVNVEGATEPAISHVEFCAMEKFTTTPALVRESLLFDIKSFDDRYKFAMIVSDMAAVLKDHVTMTQVIYCHDATEYAQYDGSMVKGDKGEYLCRYIKTNQPSQRVEYPCISTDVSHIEKSFKFHSHKHTVNPLSFSEDNLINKSDMIVFVGVEGGEDSAIFSVFRDHNELNNDWCFVDSAKEYEEKVLSLEDGDDDEKIFRSVLVSDGAPNLLYDLVNLKHEKVGAVVYDTFSGDVRDTRRLLSLCRTKNITCMRKVQRHGRFNIGVVDKGEQTTESYHTGNAVVTMTNGTILDEYLFVVFIDPRMAQLPKMVIAMEMASETWCITIVQDALDGAVQGHVDYKFFPLFQTEGINRVVMMASKHTLHTPIAMYTDFPSIAIKTVDAGMFTCCFPDKIREYVANVNAIYDEAVAEVGRKNVSRVVDMKLKAYKYVTDVAKKADMINPSIPQGAHQMRSKGVMRSIVKGKHERGLQQVFNQLKIQ